MENIPPWFKFYGSEYLSDPKIQALSACERSCWVTLLAYASLSNGVIKHLTEDRLMVQAGVNPMEEEWNRIKGIYEKFESLEMIRNDDGVITIINWAKRQERAMTPYERTKKWREGKKEKEDDDGVKRDDDAHDDTREEKIREEKKNTFARFWTSYPNKVSKKKAEIIWSRIPKLEHDRIFKALDVFKVSRQWTKDGGAFIPHPTTWLNQERWKDEGVGTGPVIVSKKCQLCKKDVTSSWIEVPGGVMHDACFNAKPNKRLTEMKADALRKTTIKN